MKALMIMLALMMHSNAIIAQYISLGELISLTSKDFDYANNYLINKGWRFTGAEEEREDYKASVSWGYGVNNFTTAAAAFINMYPEDEEPSILSYQTVNKLYYDMYRKKILEYRMQRVGSSIEDGSIITVYEGANYLVRIEVSTDSMSNKPIYIFRVSRKSD